MLCLALVASAEHIPRPFSYFNRDVACIRAFFSKRFRYESTVYPKFSTIMRDGRRDFDLDVQVEASGFTKGHQAEIERVSNRSCLHDHVSRRSDASRC